MGLSDIAGSMSVEDWIAFVLSSADSDKADERAPKLPAVDIQKLTNNLHGIESLRGAARLYVLVAREVGSRLGPGGDIKILDFGCGWGRFARFFPQLAQEENIFGVDVDNRLIDACRETLVRMRFSVITARKPLPFPDEEFVFVFCNSVFSHLNQEAQHFCIREIGRCTKAGGLFIATTMGLRNLQILYKKQEAWLTGVLGPRSVAEESLRAGGFVFGPTGRWQDYGLAFVPENWTRANWLPMFDIADVKTGFSQDVNIAVRRRG